MTTELADQVFDALGLLLRGFERAAERDGVALLEQPLARGRDSCTAGYSRCCCGSCSCSTQRTGSSCRRSTGGEGKTAYARPTDSVVRELFEHAERHVIIAGYSFDHGASILAPLHERMASRGVAVDLYLHVDRARRGSNLDEHLEHEIATFFATDWPFGNPQPTVYVAPRTIDPTFYESLHAKCVVIDEQVALLGSVRAGFGGPVQSRDGCWSVLCRRGASTESATRMTPRFSAPFRHARQSQAWYRGLETLPSTGD